LRSSLEHRISHSTFRRCARRHPSPHPPGAVGCIHNLIMSRVVAWLFLAAVLQQQSEVFGKPLVRREKFRQEAPGAVGGGAQGPEVAALASTGITSESDDSVSGSPWL